MNEHRYQMLIIVVLTVATLVGCGGETATPGDTVAETPTHLVFASGTPVSPEGRLSVSEWEDAGSVSIDLDSARNVVVHYKRDRDAIALAFTNVSRWGIKLFPELLIDLDNERDSVWSLQDKWFHVSYEDCEGAGEYDVWDCAPLKRGWFANNFPTAAVEMRLSLEHLGLNPDSATTIGLALVLMDSTGARVYWPEGATIENPSTWGQATIGRK